jgi:spermidine synthase
LLEAENFARPYVVDDGQALSLHFSHSELQSRMDANKPWQLEVDYTLTMMGFLLLQPVPKRIAMIGLGGGSLAKFCYRYLPDCHFTAVEINPHVIALREAFCIPLDNHRFEILQADGVDFVASPAEPLDVLLIDGFDQNGQPAALCSQGFYDDCFERLAPNGLLVVNLHYDSPDYPLWVARILRSFDGCAVEVAAPEKSNCIVFASREAPIASRKIKLSAALARLERAAQLQLRPEFTRLSWQMRDADTQARDTA